MVTHYIYGVVTMSKQKELTVYKRDDMIQKSRLDLTLREQRLVLYAISKIKQGDTVDTLYELNIREIYNIVGAKDESYTRIKKIAQSLSDKSWWVILDDNSESLVRWFSVFRIVPDTDTIRLKFHEDVMPFLFELLKQHKYYTSYGLSDVLPMRRQSSPRLYEILKSYSKNNSEWYFDLERIKYLLNCQHYDRWVDLKRRVIDPAMQEINELTNMIVNYAPVTKGRKVIGVKFFMKDIRDSFLF